MSYVTTLCSKLYSTMNWTRFDSGPGQGDNITTDLAVNGLIISTFADFVGDGIRPGDLAEVRLNSAHNNGFYIVLEVVDLNTLLVNYTFEVQVDTNDKVKVYTDPYAKQSQRNISAAFAADNAIQATGALFVANGVVPGDTVYIDQDTNNNGVYMVLTVVDESNITVQTLDEGAVVFTAGAATGTVGTSESLLCLTVHDEATPTWSAAQAGHPSTILKSTIGDSTVDSTTLYLVKHARIDITRSGATACNWIMNAEIVLRNRAILGGGIASSAGVGMIRVPLGDGATAEATVNVGAAGGDRYGVTTPSVFLGWIPMSVADSDASLLSVSARGALIGSLLSGSAQVFFLNSELTASVLWDDMSNFRGGCQVESFSQESNNFGVVAFGTNDIENFLVCDSAGAGLFSATGTITGFLKSSDAFTPVISVINHSIVATILDPRDDYTSAEMFDILNAPAPNNSQGIISYTWNPRFLTPAGDPIAGLRVSWQLLLFTTTPFLGETVYTTSAAGRINGDVGVPLIRWAQNAGGADIEFGERIRVSNGTTPGKNYQYLTIDMILRAPLDVDIVVNYSQTDFEGEFNF